MSKLDLNLIWKLIRLQALISPTTTVKQDKEVQKELIKIKAENIDHLVEQSYWFTDYSVRGRYDNLEHYKICTTAESASDILTQVVYRLEINKLHKKYPNLSYFLIMHMTQNKHLYLNYRTGGCVYEYLETLPTGNMQIKSLEIIRLNYVKYGILFEKTIKFLAKNDFDSCTIERMRSFILAFNPSCKLGKGADKLFVIYKKFTTNLNYNFDNLVRYLKDKPYILKTSYKEFRNFLEGFLWLFPNRIERKIKFDCSDISPSFIYVILFELLCPVLQ